MARYSYFIFYCGHRAYRGGLAFPHVLHNLMTLSTAARRGVREVVMLLRLPTRRAPVIYWHHMSALSPIA